MDFKGLQRLSKALRGTKRLSKATKYSQMQCTHNSQDTPLPKTATKTICFIFIHKLLLGHFHAKPPSKMRMRM